MRFFKILLCAFLTMAFSFFPGGPGSAAFAGNDYDVLGSPHDEVFLTKDLFLTGSTGTVNVYNGELALLPHPDKSDWTVPFLYYKSRRHGPRPLVVIHPSLEGVTIMEKTVASYLAHKGISVLIFSPKIVIQDYERSLDEVDGVFKMALFSMKMLIDWGVKRPEEFDSSKMGVFGMSLGGILSSMVMGQDSRIKGGYLVVAGGDLPGIMAHGNNTYLTKYRALRIKKDKLDGVKGYEAALRKIFDIDPLKLSINRSADDIYMVMAGADQVVPYHNQKMLWEALGRPKFSILPHQGHAVTVLTVPFRLGHIHSFFCRRWCSAEEMGQVQSEDQQGQLKQNGPFPELAEDGGIKVLE